MSFENKSILVTGGASGIGASVVRKAVKAGGRVYFSDVQTDKGKALAQEVQSTFVKQDVTDEALWTEVVDKIVAETGRFDVLVNNAGIYRPGSIEDVDVATLQELLDVNLIGPTIGCREAIRVMKNNPAGPIGSIVNVSSITGQVGLAFGAAYSASKGAVRLLSKSIAVHCAREYRTIRCNSVYPGAIDTPMNDTAFAAAEDPAALRAQFETLQPIGRMTSADEVADGILYLASDAASGVTGSELIIDGGWLATPPGL